MKNNSSHKVFNKLLCTLKKEVKSQKIQSKSAVIIECNGQNVILATFNRRLLATTLDIFIISILTMPLNFFMSFIGFNDETIKMQINTELMLNDIDALTFIQMLYNSGVLTHIILMQLLLMVVITLYTSYFWYKKGATPGKMLFKCMIVDATTGLKPSFKQSLIRTLSIPLSIIPLLLGVFMIEFTKKKQALHDKIAKTLVIKYN